MPKLLVLADTHSEDESDERVFPLTGKITVVANAERIEGVRVNLVTKKSISVDRALFEYEMKFFDNEFELGADIVRNAKDCLTKSSTAPASLKGVFVGHWICKNRPKLL